MTFDLSPKTSNIRNKAANGGGNDPVTGDLMTPDGQGHPLSKILLKNPTGGASSLFAGTLSRALAQALSDFPVFSTKLGTKLATKEGRGGRLPYSVSQNRGFFNGIK